MINRKEKLNGIKLNYNRGGVWVSDYIAMILRLSFSVFSLVLSENINKKIESIFLTCFQRSRSSSQINRSKCMEI